MAFLDTPAEELAHGDVARLYDGDRAHFGYVQNLTKMFALRPDIYDAWARLNKAIKSGMDLRRYELVTLAAAKRLRSTYCALAHGAILRDRFYGTAGVRKIAADRYHADLDPVDIAIMDFADKAARDAATVTIDDVERLRKHGLSDVEIFQIILATAARCFFSTVLDAAGVEPDSQYRSSIEPELRQVLTIGRPIPDEA